MYRLSRLAFTCIGEKEIGNVEILIEGKKTMSKSIVQEYRKEFGWLRNQDNGSIFISTFKEYSKHSYS